MAKLYKRIGIRRDNNFSDLGDSKEALNNLLDKLGTDIPGGTFISEDLDAIRGLFATGLSNTEYRQFGGSTVKETNINGGASAVDPPITYQNRLDKFKVSSGESPRLNGGNGLTANYFNEDQVKFDTVPDIFVGVTTGPSIPSDNFWEAGNFVYSRKINAKSISAAGGAQWDGFFIPTQTGEHTFFVSGTLGFSADFEKEGYTTGIGTFTSHARVGLTTTISTGSANAATDQVTITGASAPGQAVNIGVGMTFVSGTPSRVALGSRVTGVSTSANTCVITFENENEDPVPSSGSMTNFTLSRDPGDAVSKSFNTHTLEQFRPYRIRFRFFVPEGVDISGINKSFNVDFLNPQGTVSANLRYNNLYSLNYDFSDEAKGTFNKFLDQSLLFGGNKTDGTETIGSTTNSNGYVRVSTNKKVDIKYQPKTALTQIERATYNTSWNAGSKVISLSDTTNIEIGNYVFSASQGLTANVNTPVRVTLVAINKFVVIDAAATNTRNSVDLTFVDHRGFVKRVTGSGTGGNISISNADTNPNTFGLRTNQVAIWGGNQTSQAYTGITTSGANSTVGISPAQTFTSRRVYFYESRGLIDKALATFCVPAETQCFLVTSQTNAPATTLPTTDTSNISVGYKIQGFPFAANTVVTGKTANSLTISPATVKNIAPDSNFTATSSNDDKSLCCPPTDTSPPFEPTAEGLATTGAFPNIKINQGNLKFDNLIINSPQNKNNVSALNTALVPASGNVLPILGGDGIEYDLICE
tara:strand:+ start:267 stop:2537 length:2271 start_codon:yes stop_codon:yes gene_type:complete